MNQSEINKYLYFKNLEINRKYSSNKKIIKKLDHYIWWFQDQKKENHFSLLKINYQYIFQLLISFIIKIKNLYTLD